MDQPGAPPPAEAEPRTPSPGRLRLHPPSLGLGLLLGGLGALLIFTAWQRNRPPLAEVGDSPAPAATSPSSPPSSPRNESGPESAPAARTSGGGSRNRQIDALLNSADMAFRAEMDGCQAVSLAIRLAQEPDDTLRQGEVHPAQRREISTYAERCGLRF